MIRGKSIRSGHDDFPLFITLSYPDVIALTLRHYNQRHPGDETFFTLRSPDVIGFYLEKIEGVLHRLLCGRQLVVFLLVFGQLKEGRGRRGALSVLGKDLQSLD